MKERRTHAHPRRIGWGFVRRIAATEGEEQTDDGAQ